MSINPQPARQAATRAFCVFNLASFVIGAKAANTINVAVTLKSARGQAVGLCVADVYLSDSADGHTLTATVPTSPIVVHTNGVLLATLTATKMVKVLTKTDGTFDLDIIQTAGGTNYYLVVVVPDGSIIVSPVIAF